MKRRRSRGYVLQILFQLDVTNSEFNEDVLKDFWENIKEDDDVKEFTNSVVRGARENIGFIDEIIKDIQRALIEADVNVELVFALSQKIKKLAYDETIKGIDMIYNYEKF